VPSIDAEGLQNALQALAARAASDHRLQAELQRARREFFGAGTAVPAAPARELRFLEWFLLERESLALAAVPAHVVDLTGEQEALLGSSAGVWCIESVGDGIAEARDLQDDDVVDLLAPAGSLEPGDLMVGRVYPLDSAGRPLDGAGRPRGRAGWQPSAAVAIHRPGRALAAAFQRDLARLGLDRRLSQAELEHLLLQRRAPEPAASASRPIEHIEAELDAVLQAGGAAGAAAEISRALAESDRAGAVAGPLLDELAFDTDVDLDRARRLLVELWGAHHAASAVAEPAGAEPVADARPQDTAQATGADPGADDETLGARLLRTLDRGLEQHKDVGELFSELEAMAGIEPDEDGPGDDELAEDAGDLAPLVTEFLWEKGQSGSDVEATLRLWLSLQQNAALPHLDLEQVTHQDLLRLLLHVYLRAAPEQRAAAVRAAFAALREFSAWAEETQDMSLDAQLVECGSALVAGVDRLQAASLRLSGAGTDAARQVLLRVEEVASTGFGVRHDEAHHWLAAERDAAALLREGDLLLGSLAPGRRAALRGLVVVLPGCAAELIG
jgi:hypothetical protein